MIKCTVVFFAIAVVFIVNIRAGQFDLWSKEYRTKLHELGKLQKEYRNTWSQQPSLTGVECSMLSALQEQGK